MGTLVIDDCHRLRMGCSLAGRAFWRVVGNTYADGEPF